MQTAPQPLKVTHGKGTKLYLEDGRVLLDAISSWWVTVHGHAHPHVAEAIARQANTLEQVIFAGFTHPEAERLADRLVGHLPTGLDKVFFSDDGSTAVEVALKMAWQYWNNKGVTRNRILAFEGAYHGDTFGAMSASARSIFTKAFGPLMFDVQHLPSLSEDPEGSLETLKKALKGGDVAGLIVEPLVQGAGGMLMHSPEHLDMVTSLCQSEGVPVIFDEVMTGFYRTGRLFAMNHCQHKPDIVCLAKGLTGGFLPLSITVARSHIYDAFLSQDRGKMLFHGHSFTANPIGCAAANASLDLFESPELPAKIMAITQWLGQLAISLRHTGKVKNIRQTGTILAFDLPSSETGYLSTAAVQVRDRLFSKGILIRPLGEVVYLLPPYCVEREEMQTIYEELLAAIQDL
jgi:adenosylmethionine-8-amino-7-oxononanoate aminotransferase